MAAADPEEYYEAVGGGQLAILGGGLNNMLMNLAELLTHSCEAGGVLLLPPLDAEPTRDTSTAAILRQCKKLTYRLGRSPVCEWEHRPRPALATFDEVFDLEHFERRLRGMCGGRSRFVALAPPSGARIVPVPVTPLSAHWWDVRKYSPMLRAVYAAVRPSAKVRGLVDALVAEVSRRAGERWAAVHLPIETDWWWQTDWCQGRADENYTRRCWTPHEVGRITRARMRATRASGIALLYAHEKVAP